MLVKRFNQVNSFTYAKEVKWNEILIPRANATRYLFSYPKWYILDGIPLCRMPMQLFKPGQQLDDARWVVEDCLKLRLPHPRLHKRSRE